MREGKLSDTVQAPPGSLGETSMVDRGGGKRPRWGDAIRAAEQITEGERRTLSLLVRLPFVSVKVLERLAGLRGGASMYRSLARLRAAGLVNFIRPPLQPGYSPRLLYLTDLGLATVALDQNVEPAALAQHFRLRENDLVALLPGLRLIFFNGPVRALGMAHLR